MPGIYRYIPLALLLLASLSHAQEVSHELPGWQEGERIRAYWSPPVALFDALKEAGFNTIIQRLETAVTPAQRATGSLHPSYTFEAVEADVRASSRRAKELGLRYFHCLDPGAAGAIAQAGFADNPRRYQNGKLPCPLDDVYWDRVITHRFLAVINLLSGDDYRLDGLIIDPEMYTFSGAFLSIPCYCDHCAAEFGAPHPDLNEVAEAPIDERAPWLATKKARDDYETWQQTTVRQRVAAMREAIHARQPDLQLGFLIFRDRPWFKALAQGLSTPEKPVLICPEGTYSGAYNEDYLAYQAGLSDKVGAPFFYCPGIWVGYDNSGELPTEFMKAVPGNVYHRSIRSAGYWVYASTRWGGTPEKAQPFTALFRTLNDELDSYQQSGGTYESALTAQALPLERPGNLHELLLEARDWKAVEDVPQTVPRSSDHLGLRGQHQVVFQAKRGDDVTVQLQHFQLGSYTSAGRVIVYNPTMEVIAEATCGVNQRIELPLTAPADGPYVVLASAGSGVPNAFSVKVEGAPWVLYGEQVTFNKRGGRVYFWIDANQESVTATLSGGGKERASFALSRPDGTTALTADAVTRAENHTLPTDGAAGIWSLKVHSIDDDGYFRVHGVNRYALSPEHVINNG